MVAEFVSPENCIGCAMCAKMCPDVCISVEK
jgi:NAD-dependent dihydropyrimidine dehydrogenase PreA subunit